MTLLERDVERKIAQYAKEKGMLTYKFTSPACRGVCDRIFIFMGRVLFMEIKTSTGKLSENQKRHQSLLRSHGANAVVVYGFEQGKETIDEFFEGKRFTR